MNARIRLLLAATLLAATGAAHAAPPVWREVNVNEVPLAGPRLIAPERARVFEVALPAVTAVLAKAPLEGVTGAAQPVLRLPMPYRGTISFRIVESPVMAPELGAKFPETRTYAGTAVSDPTITGRFQIDPRGFRAIWFTPKGTVYIDPLTRGDAVHHQAYYAHDMPERRRPRDTVLPYRRAATPATPALGPVAQRGASIAGELRTYRLAYGATYQYSTFHDPGLAPDHPSKPVVNAEIVNVVNRVTGVYQRELGIRMVLVANNENAIYTTPAQPYADADGLSMVYSNTAILDANIGNANYDIGHVGSTGGGGVAILGCVCDDTLKGGGVTGLPAPIGDAYYIDFVAHEMGHQFGGNHTFNGNTGSCDGNGNGPTAYEPGSGVTIMAYAGICPGQDIAPHSIDTFHAASFDEIIAFKHGDGSACGQVSNTNNKSPNVATPAGGFTIPKGTPFELTGAACDDDNDPLLYQWEQMDLGAAGHPDDAANAASGQTPPLFRDFLPQASPTRTFPQLADIVANRHRIGEILPNNTRALKFRLTARDYKSEAGGVGSADLNFDVTDTAGPFKVTQPNEKANFPGGTAIDATWDVANTAAAPVSCAAVDVLLSTDGGFTYPTTLVANTPNDGLAPVTLPDIVTSTARIKVRCATSVFFDISDENFRINQPTEPLGDASVCVVPGVLKLLDDNGDQVQAPPGTEAQLDILSLHIAEPGQGPLANKVVFTLTTRGFPGGTAPGGTRWVLRFTSTKRPPAGQDDYFVMMTTEEGAAPTFRYGTSGVVSDPIVGVAGARIFTIEGDLDPASAFFEDGRIQLVLPRDNPLIGPLSSGVTLSGLFPSIRAPATPSNNAIYDQGEAVEHVLIDPAICPVAVNLPPELVVDPGYSIDEGASGLLSGSATDPEDDELTYQWTQVSPASPTAVIDNPGMTDTSFTAPAVDADTQFTFRLSVTDGENDPVTADVVMTVRNVGTTPPGVTGKPLVGNNRAGGGLPLLTLLLLGGLALARRRGQGCRE
jgi:hypothetical protein